MKLTPRELKIIKNSLSDILENAYKAIDASNAKELAFAPIKDFNNNIDIIGTQSTLKKIIDEIVNETTNN